MKIEYMHIEGKKYPLSFSLATAEQIAEKYKNMNELQRKLKDENFPDSEKLDILCNVLAMMIYSGCCYFNAFHKPPYENAPYEDEKFYYITSEQLKTCIPLNDNKIKEIINKIENCINSSGDKKISTRPKQISSNSKKKTRRY